MKNSLNLLTNQPLDMKKNTNLYRNPEKYYELLGDCKWSLHYTCSLPYMRTFFLL